MRLFIGPLNFEQFVIELEKVNYESETNWGMGPTKFTDESPSKGRFQNSL